VPQRRKKFHHYHTLTYNKFTFVSARLEKLNADQRTAANAVLAAVDKYMKDRDSRPGELVVPKKSSVFFIEGCAGTGKTTTYKAICDIIQAAKQEVLCMAFTGSAACLLPNGRTCHNALKVGSHTTVEILNSKF